MQSPAKRPWWAWGACADTPERDLRNQRRFVVWCLAWAISFTAATFILVSGRPLPMAAGLLVALVPTVLGLGAVAAYTRYLREADEFQRRVQLEALALGFGAGILFMMGYRLLMRLGAPELDINDPMLVMLLTWSGWQLVAARRYQ